MRNVTRYFSAFGCASVLLLAAAVLNPILAQTHRLTITAPASVAGSYNVLLQSWSGSYCTVAGVDGNLFLTRDRANATTVCDSVTADLTGKISVIDRGVCAISDKAARAQAKGAKAVVVFNNQGGTVIPNFTGNQVNIPVFTMSQNDGLKIKAALGAEIACTITRLDLVDDTNPAQIVWGSRPGQGDFNGGLSGWRIRDLSCGTSARPTNLWSWNGTGVARGSCGGATINSPSRCNGAMIFESDFYDNGQATTCAGTQGQGPCPAPQAGELISPVIKLPRRAAGYSVKFYQSTRQFNSSYFVGWSKNGGRTWDSIAVNTDIAVNAASTEPYVVAPLRNTGDADSLIIKFRYQANYYYWLIDDVLLLEQESNNLRVNSFFAVPPNAATPLSQVESFGFLADVENIGARAQTDVKLFMTIADATSNRVVYTDSLAYNTINGNTLVENVPFARQYTPTARGGFVGIYSVEADSADFDDSDNVDGFVFAITDTTFAKEFGATRTTNPAATNWAAGDPHAAAYGNGFFVPKGRGNFLRSVSFAFNNGAALKDQPLLISLYEWRDANNDGDAQPAERILVGTRIYTVLGTETATQLVTTSFPEPGDPLVELKDNTYYLLMVEYIPAGSPTLDIQMAQSEEVDYSATALLGELIGKPRYASFTGLAGDLSTEVYGSVGFGRRFSYVVRMNVGARPTSNRELPSINNQFAVFPNPTNDMLYLQLLLKETAKEAEVRIMDLTGKILSVRQLENVQRDNHQFDVSDLSAGAYLLQVTTPTGVGVKRFVVNK